MGTTRHDGWCDAQSRWSLSLWTLRLAILAVIVLAALCLSRPCRQFIAERKLSSAIATYRYDRALEAIHALDQLDERDYALECTAKLLTHEDVSVQQTAAYVLYKVVEPADTVVLTRLIEVVSRDSYNLDAMLTLGRFGKLSAPLLVDRLGSDDSSVRARAAVALGMLGQNATEAREPLLALMKDSDAEVRESVAFAIGNIKLKGEDINKVFAVGLSDSSGNVRFRSAYALAKMGGAAASAMPALIAALRDSDARVRGYAARALGRIGQPARDAEPLLLELKEDSDGTVSEEAADALARIAGISPCVRE